MVLHKIINVIWLIELNRARAVNFTSNSTSQADVQVRFQRHHPPSHRPAPLQLQHPRPPGDRQHRPRPRRPTTKYAHNALGQRVFKTEALYNASASSLQGDKEEEDPACCKASSNSLPACGAPKPVTQNTWAGPTSTMKTPACWAITAWAGRPAAARVNTTSPYGDEGPTLGAKRLTNETTTPTTGATSIAPARFKLLDPDFSGFY